MDIRQVVHITLADQAPKIIDGYWHEWVNGEWINTGVKAEVKDGSNYLIFGFWMNNVQYKLSDAGIHVVKIPDSTAAKYSVYKLIAPVSTLGSFIPTQWELVESAEFIYMQDAYIEHLQATMVTAKTLRTDSEGARTEIDTEGIKVFNAMNNMNIRFGLKEGYAVMQYFDNNGILLYDLGPTGIVNVNIREEKWTPVKLIFVALSFEDALHYNNNFKYKESGSLAVVETTFYRYTSKIVADVNQDPTNDGRLFKNNNKSSGYIGLGVYTTKSIGMEMQMQVDNTNLRVYPPNIHASNEAVYDTHPLYFKELVTYVAGERKQSIYAYWNTGFPEI